MFTHWTNLRFHSKQQLIADDSTFLKNTLCICDEFQTTQLFMLFLSKVVQSQSLDLSFCFSNPVTSSIFYYILLCLLCLVIFYYILLYFLCLICFTIFYYILLDFAMFCYVLLCFTKS